MQQITKLGLKGQSLIELIVVIAMTVLVVGALTIATIASMRNADLAKSQVQATKLAQEGIEKVKTIRDQNTDGGISYSDSSNNYTKFSNFWGISFSCKGGSPNCYFKLIKINSLDVLKAAQSVNDSEPIQNGAFTRQILVEDGASGATQKTITVVVTWTDYSGSHESRLVTYLGKI